MAGFWSSQLLAKVQAPKEASRARRAQQAAEAEAATASATASAAATAVAVAAASGCLWAPEAFPAAALSAVSALAPPRSGARPLQAPTMATCGGSCGAEAAPGGLLPLLPQALMQGASGPAARPWSLTLEAGGDSLPMLSVLPLQVAEAWHQGYAPVVADVAALLSCHTPMADAGPAAVGLSCSTMALQPAPLVAEASRVLGGMEGADFRSQGVTRVSGWPLGGRWILELYLPAITRVPAHLPALEQCR